MIYFGFKKSRCQTGFFWVVLFVSMFSRVEASPPLPERYVHVSPELTEYGNTIVEFLNYSCVYCFRADQGLEVARDSLGGKYKFVRIPISFRMDGSAYYSTLAAIVLDKYDLIDEFHQYLFKIVQVPLSWEVDAYERLSSLERVRALLVDWGVPDDEVEVSIVEAKKELEKNLEFARRVGVHGTPAVLVNGKYILNGLASTPLPEKVLALDIKSLALKF
ncbi:thioredoxin domain-containing protein [Pseudomonas lijiangensis]|uniref:thioredoxin domain-containing protein n=1 Tax=Pseudomonas lijiangensis TaxID=2995658 RepID=UPI0031BA9097